MSICFIVTPIGKPESETRKKTDNLIDKVITPVLESRQIESFVSHRHYEPENINYEIIKHLLNDDLVIANLSGLNPNVMYELGIRHATALPIVTIAEDGTELPFDFSTERTLSFDVDLSDAKDFKKELDLSIESALKREDSESTVTRVAKLEQIRNSTGIEIPQLITDLLDDISSRVIDIHEGTRDFPRIIYEDIMETAMYRELDGYSFKTDYQISTEVLQKALFEIPSVDNLYTTGSDDKRIVCIFSDNSSSLLEDIKEVLSKLGIQAIDYRKIKGRNPPY